MTKEQYIESLKKELQGIDEKEAEDAIRYCEEYFDEAEDKDVDQIIKELGSPKQFASQIRNDKTFKKEVKPPKFNPKKEHRTRNVILWVLVGLVVLYFVFRLIIGIGSFVVFSSISMDQTTTHESTLSNWNHYLESASGIEIEVDGNITIKHGDKNQIMIDGYDANEVEISREGNTIKIESDSDIYEAEKIELIVDDDVKYISVENDRGNIKVMDMQGTHLSLDTEWGNITLENVLYNKIELETETGDIQGTINGKETDYLIKVDNGTGYMKIGGFETAVPGESILNTNTNKELDVSSDRGNVEIQFTA